MTINSTRRPGGWALPKAPVNAPPKTTATPQAPARANVPPQTPGTSDGFDHPPARTNTQSFTGSAPAGQPADPQLLSAQTTYNRVTSQPGGQEALTAAGVGSPEELLALEQGLNQDPPDAEAVGSLKKGLAAAPPATQQLMMDSFSLQSPGLARLTQSDAELSAATSGQGIPASTKPEEAHPTEAEAAAMPQEDKDALAAIGLTPEDVVGAGPAVAELVLAGEAALEGRTDEALTHLQSAAEQGAPLVEKAVTTLAQKLPEPARSMLTDPAVVNELLTAAPGALEKMLFEGDVLGGLADLSELPATRDKLLGLAAQHEPLKGSLEAMGLTVDDLTAAGAALPDLLRALSSADRGEWTEALGHLESAAAHGGGDLAAKVVAHAAGSLPEGSPARQLLSDPAVAKALLESGADLIGPLLEGGDVGTLLEQLKELPDNGELLTALSNNAWVQEQLGQLGLTPEQLGDALQLLPDLVAAGKAALEGDWEGALATLQQLGGNLTPALKDLLAKGINSAAAKLPDDNPLKPYLTDPAVSRALLDSAPEALAALKEGDILGALATLGDNDALRDAVIDVAAKDPAFVERLAKFGLDPATLKEGAAGVPDLIRGIQLAEKGQWDEAIDAFATAAQKGSGLASKALARFAEELPEGPIKSLLQDEQLINGLLQSAPELVKQLRNGDLAGAMQAIEANPDLMATLQQSQAMNELLGELGIPENLRGEALAIAPTLFLAMDAMDRGDWQGALEQLQYAAGKAPNLMGALGTQLASKLPDGQPWDAAKTLLEDGNLLSALVSDPALHENLRKILSQEDVLGGLQGLLSDPNIQQGAANALFSAFEPQLAELGITDASQLQGLLAAVPDLMTALGHVRAGEWDQALDALGAAASKVDPAALSGVFSALAQKLDLPPGMEKLRDLFQFAGDILRTPGGPQALGKLITAFRTNDVGLFGTALSELGGVIQQMDPTQQENFLNALGTALPGKMGALFQDPELNRALAQSGSLNHLFGAAQHLLNGDFTKALEELGHAAVALLGNPSSPDELKQGLENFGRLFKQVFETLPNAIRNRIEMSVMASTANLLGNIPVIGDLIDAGKDFMELIDELQEGDNLGAILAAAQLGVDGAKATQVGKIFTGPLEMILGLAQGVDDAMDAYEEMKDEFGTIMMTGNDTTERLEMDKDERRLLTEVARWGTDYGLTPEQMVQFVKDHPELKNDTAGVGGVIMAAQAAGVPPDQFEAFVAALQADLGGDFDDQMEQLGWLTEEEPSLLLARIMDKPSAMGFLQDTLGIDPHRRLVELVYQQTMGRAPTEEEVAKYTQYLQEEAGDGWGYPRAQDLLQAELEGTEEWQNRQNAA